MEFPECEICRDKITQNTSKVLLCGHSFHFVCIDALQALSRKCPVCSQSFYKNSNNLPTNYLYDNIIELNQAEMLKLKENESIRKKERIIKNLQEDKKKIRNDYENKLKKNNEIIENLGKEKKILLGRIDKEKQGTINDFNDKLEKSEKKNKDMMIENSSLKNQIDSLKTKNDSLINKTKSQTIEIDSLKTKNDSLKKKNKSQTIEIDSFSNIYSIENLVNMMIQIVIILTIVFKM